MPRNLLLLAPLPGRLRPSAPVRPRAHWPGRAPVFRTLDEWRASTTSQQGLPMGLGLRRAHKGELESGSEVHLPAGPDARVGRQQNIGTAAKRSLHPLAVTDCVGRQGNWGALASRHATELPRGTSESEVGLPHAVKKSPIVSFRQERTFEHETRPAVCSLELPFGSVAPWTRSMAGTVSWVPQIERRALAPPMLTLNESALTD